MGRESGHGTFIRKKDEKYMAKLDFTIRLITPAFIGGGDDDPVKGVFHGREPEQTYHRKIGPKGDGLRIPSLKGVLRFWYRSLYGGIKLDSLKEREARIWGDAGNYQGIKIIPVDINQFQIIELEYKPGSAPAYLGYGPINNNKITKKTSSHNSNMYRDAICERSTFTFRSIGTTEQIEALKDSLQMLHYFGGLGSRSRRGFGSVAVEYDGFPPAFPMNGNITNWFNETVWNPILNREGIATQSPTYSAFYLNKATPLNGTRYKFFLGDNNALLNNYDDVFKLFHRKFAEVRLWRNPYQIPRPTIAQNDHDLEEADSKGSAITKAPLRIAYGMPYHPTSFDNHWKIEYQTTNKDIIRRASPLFLKVLQPTTNGYMGIALFLRAEFFGTTGVNIQAKGITGDKPFPRYSAVDEFMN
jgi:CRISPR-associated protein Cmr1